MQLIALNRSGLSESSVRRFRASLSAFFAWAVRERMIATNPVTGTRVPKGRGVRTEIRPFTEDELESFHLAVTARNQRLADVLLVAGWTACAGRSCARCGSATSSRCRCR